MGPFYKDPSWAAQPQGCWSLGEIKGGVEVASHLLPNPCHVFGRAADMVDIALGHESCSRVHARIAFDRRGVPWLRDLGSTHGTKVNKRALPPEACGKKEESSEQNSDGNKKGSRGVVLYPGDMIQFGASTRLFCVEGPEEYDRGAMEMKEKLAKLQRQSHSATSLVSPDQPATSSSEEPTEKAPPPMKSIEQLDASDVPEKHRKLFERIQSRRYKLHNLQTENERIMAKVELTSGQQNQLARNEEKIASLRKVLEELEDELRRKVYPEAPTNSNATQGTMQEIGGLNYDDEEVDDRTQDVRQSRGVASNEPESERSLTQKWKDQREKLMMYRNAVRRAEDKVVAMEKRMGGIDADGDEDSFFLKNDLDLAKDVYEKAKKDVAFTERSMNETERLLKIVNEKLSYDRQLGFIGMEDKGPKDGPLPMMPPPKPSPNMAPPPPPLHAKTAAISSMPPPPQEQPVPQPMTEIRKPPPPATGATTQEGSASDQRPKRPVDLEPINERSSSPGKKKTRVVGPQRPPAGGTLSFLQRGTNPKKEENNEKHKASKSNDDTRQDRWRAPKDQDGSGRTKLNDKFAGRY